MKTNSTSYLCCPACNSEFQLTVNKEKGADVLEGTLICLGCARSFEIKDGLPVLLFPEILLKSDLKNKMFHDEHADFRPRRWILKLGIWELGLFETRARRKLLDRLDLKGNVSVLETGVGNGPNLPILKTLAGNRLRLDGLDISFETLKIAQEKMNVRGVEVELVQGNGSYLPYKSAVFDAVLHVGALNQFGDKKRAIEEMIRVTKPGGKIVICDEGLAPGKEDTWLGRRLHKFDPELFAYTPPVECVPAGIDDLKVYWVWQGTHWVMEFKKQVKKLKTDANNYSRR